MPERPELWHQVTCQDILREPPPNMNNKFVHRPPISGSPRSLLLKTAWLVPLAGNLFDCWLMGKFGHPKHSTGEIEGLQCCSHLVSHPPALLPFEVFLSELSESEDELPSLHSIDRVTQSSFLFSSSSLMSTRYWRHSWQKTDQQLAAEFKELLELVGIFLNGLWVKGCLKLRFCGVLNPRCIRVVSALFWVVLLQKSDHQIRWSFTQLSSQLSPGHPPPGITPNGPRGIAHSSIRIGLSPIL